MRTTRTPRERETRVPGEKRRPPMGRRPRRARDEPRARCATRTSSELPGAKARRGDGRVARRAPVWSASTDAADQAIKRGGTRCRLRRRVVVARCRAPRADVVFRSTSAPRARGCLCFPRDRATTTATSPRGGWSARARAAADGRPRARDASARARLSLARFATFAPALSGVASPGIGHHPRPPRVASPETRPRPRTRRRPPPRHRLHRARDARRPTSKPRPRHPRPPPPRSPRP